MKNLIIILLVLLPIFAFSQSEEATIDDYYIDFAVPDLAAFTLLGIESDQVSRPGNLKEFGIALSSLTGTAGKLNPSLAIEYAPLVGLTKSTESNYWKRGFRYTNLALSLGTQVDDSLGNRASFGFKFVPIDNSNPVGDPAFYKLVRDLLRDKNLQPDALFRRDFENKIGSALKSDGIAIPRIPDFFGVLDLSTGKDYRSKLVKRHEQGEIGALSVFLTDTLKTLSLYNSLSVETKALLLNSAEKYADYILNKGDFKDDFEKKLKEAKEEYKKKNWNATVLQLSAGWVWNSDSATFEGLEKEKFTTFLGLSLPLGKKGWFKDHGQVILHISYTADESILTEIDKRFSGGTKVLLGGADQRLSIEGLFSDSKLDALDTDGNQIEDTFFRWSIGAEMKLSAGSWLEFAIGGQKLINGDNRILPSFGLKHALQKEKRF